MLQLSVIFSFRSLIVNVTYPDNDGISFEVTKNTQSGSHQFMIKSKEQIKKSTVQLLRTLISMSSTLRSLPDERFLTMKLLYCNYLFSSSLDDDRTPADYEPKFFKAEKDRYLA